MAIELFNKTEPVNQRVVMKFPIQMLMKIIAV